jgi:hypothetical protein
MMSAGLTAHQSTTRQKTGVLAAVYVADLAINLDVTIVNVALPSIATQLHADTRGLQWVVDAHSVRSHGSGGTDGSDLGSPANWNADAPRDHTLQQNDLSGTLQGLRQWIRPQPSGQSVPLPCHIANDALLRIGRNTAASNMAG